MPKQLKGIHHVTAITSSAEKIYDFYTHILGMRLVKKNVNQDDLTSFHLFFADDKGSAGTDMTFFDFKGAGPHQKGNNDISRTTFRVNDDKAIEYWMKRFDHYEIEHELKKMFDKKLLFFEDFDGQRYALISDENNKGIESGTPWLKGPVPNEFAITGLGPVFLNVFDFDSMNLALVNVMKMRYVSQEGDYHLFEMGQGGNGAAVYVYEDKTMLRSFQGYGGVHHVAFRTEDKQHIDAWKKHFDNLNLPNSGHVDRFYFESVYIRLYPGILFELATDGPGFIDDEESYEILGEKLTLPPHLRDKREYVEKHLKDFDTTRSTKVFEKEYF
ncbi:MAG TPA: ring-cleaving dioxygenase [Erysipelothrix sp.]|nr:ring-cleaving dioxygenase [Erysipelothrix sp.]